MEGWKMEVGDKGPVIFWVEDRPDTVEVQVKDLKNANIQFYMFGTPSELVSALNDELEGKNVDNLRLAFVIDIMLFGVLDLRTLGILDAPTSNGLHAGYVFADRFFRSKESRYIKKPICFLTEREIDRELKQDVETLATKGGDVHIVRKYVDEELVKFRQFIKTL
jgi:hypothetical protein